MENILNKAIESIQHSETAFTKFITANDVGATGAHQSGFHLHKSAWRLFFEAPCEKGYNKDKFVTIKWQDDFETTSRFIYYGTSTRDEYRLTRFGRGFPYLQDEHIGDLLVIVKKKEAYYEAFVLNSDEEIEVFLAALNISAANINGIIPKQSEQTGEEKLLNYFLAFISGLKVNFPSTTDLASAARYCYNSVYGTTNNHIKSDPDKILLNWLNTEYQLFKELENNRYSKRIQTPFATVEELVETANSILNRRKSRAGKSLEHHLNEVFITFELVFETQTVTEDNKKPDFLFPGASAYVASEYNEEKLVMLASKTTCKDRWRQVINEADRIKTKHLFTLQQGISRNQLEEMYKYGIRLVVPRSHVNSFPADFRERILTLNSFINYVQQKQQ
ncbi:type II restriction endonuclease [Chitinophaga sp.]|uniref:type II restriction endonuclease n=1 Tax=Chitinophaga sp. TaxID=1869181 RepID=UPI0031DBF51E